VLVQVVVDGKPAKAARAHVPAPSGLNPEVLVTGLELVPPDSVDRMERQVEPMVCRSVMVCRCLNSGSCFLF
jgi:hypothetical protein